MIESNACVARKLIVNSRGHVELVLASGIIESNNFCDKNLNYLWLSTILKL